ncbi:hypothetical protein GCM10010302_55920 [Streptomyces polychromogenes]|uniref:Uncharacterized protein n=1 Tax=Streptomyces polychromogenes TaxID=67342 RepID=A0ABN0VLS0_9ACTN
MWWSGVVRGGSADFVRQTSVTRGDERFCSQKGPVDVSQLAFRCPAGEGAGEEDRKGPGPVRNKAGPLLARD